MSHCLIASVGAVVIAAVALTLTPVAGPASFGRFVGVVDAAGEGAQGQSSAVTTSLTSDTSTPPRTPWGDPDLQGIWSFATITPLERPGDLAGKPVLTEEEAAALEARSAENRFDRPPRQGDPGTYNRFWVDQFWSQKVVPTRQTSLVVDPPDGRMPPFTPDGQKRMEAQAALRQRPAHGPEDRSVGERCMLGFNAGPPMLPGGYNQNVPDTWCFSTRWSMMFASSRSTDARLFHHTSASGRATRGVVGRATRWSSTPEISMTRPRSEGPAPTCIWSNASRVRTRTRCSTSSRSRTRRRGRDPGRCRCR